MTLQLHDLSLDGLDAVTDGKPLALALDSIDEDPEQPRVEFDAAAMQELAATIAERGVRQPISVRPHPEAPGRWLLNFGARRLRGSRIAGKSSIPAFVDDTADRYDQVVENEQRERLTPLEMSLFIARRLRAGDSQAEIARRLGKSRQYVTLATALIDAPDWLMAMYREGRCRGLNELYELRRLSEQHPGAVAEWIGTRSGVSRSDLDTLRTGLATPPDGAAPTRRPAAPRSAASRRPSTPVATVPQPVADTPSRAPHALMATLNGHDVEVLLQDRVAGADDVMVRHLNGQEHAAPTASLTQLRLVRR